MRIPPPVPPAHSPRPGWASRFAIAAILLLAVTMRWAALDLVEFKYDEAHITGMAMQVARGAEWPLLSGGTTLGLQRPALDVYLLAFPLWLTGAGPEVGVWWLGGLAAVAVALTYGLGKRVGGEAVGLAASFYMAANPWLALYDRKLWAHIQALLSVLALWLAWEALTRRSRRAAFWFPVTAALQLLTHTLALVQGLSWLAGFLVAPRRWPRRELARGLVVGVLLLAPYIWAETRWLLHSLQGSSAATTFAHLLDKTSAAPALNRWRGLMQVFGGSELHTLAGLPAETHLAWQWSAAAAALVLFFVMAGLAKTALQLRERGPNALSARLLLAWAAGPFLVLAVAPLAVFPQYWTVLLPLPALFFGLGVVATARVLARATGARWLRFVPAAALAAILLTWTPAYAHLLADVAQGAGAASFGVPLRRWRQALNEAQTWAERLGTDQVRVAVRGVDPGQDGDAAVVAALIGNPPWARFVAASTPPALLLAEAEESLYFWWAADPEGERRLAELGEMVWEGVLARDAPPVRLYRVPPASPASLHMIPLEPRARFDIGLELAGYSFRVLDGGEVEATLMWRVVAPREDVRVRDFTAFNHILDAATRERVAQVDGMAALSRDWWPGDVLVQPYRVRLEPGNYIWHVGLYSRADGARAQVMGDGDAVDLPFVVR